MFLCDGCRTKSGHQFPYTFRSLGKCELCGKEAECVDVPSSTTSPDEDPEVAAAVARATEELTGLLKASQLEVDYCEADWRDTQGLIEDAHALMLKHPGWELHYVGGDTFGIDSNFVFLASHPVGDEVIEEIGDLILNQGAELPEEVVPPKPKCPKCGEKIDAIGVVYSATVAGWIDVGDKEHTVQFPESRLEPWDIIDEGTAVYECPHCNEVLFKADQEAEMIAFLKCEHE